MFAAASRALRSHMQLGRAHSAALGERAFSHHASLRSPVSLLQRLPQHGPSPCRASRQLEQQQQQQQQQQPELSPSARRTHNTLPPEGQDAVQPDSDVVSGSQQDPDEQDPQQRINRLQKAMREGTLGFGFSAGGFVYPYHMGVLWELKRLGVLQGQVKMAGASAGALAIAVYNSGLDVETATKALLDFALDCRKDGVMLRLALYCNFLTGSVLKRFLELHLPDDAHVRCSGTTFVAMTSVFPFWHSSVVSQFPTKADFIQALLASCHIPMYLNGNPFTRFRNRWVMDGALTNLIPSPPTPSVIKVCCFPVSDLVKRVPKKRIASVDNFLDIAISPDAFDPWPYNYAVMAKWALAPASDDELHMLVARGRQDAATWARRMQLVKEDDIPWLGAP